MNSPTEIVKPRLEFARNLKLLVVVLAIAIPSLVFYFAPYNNFGQITLPSLGFSSSGFKLNGFSSSSVYSHDDPVYDNEYYELRKVLKAASTDDKTVILTTLNEAWAEPNSIYDLFLESFKIGNNTARLLNHLLVIAIGEKAYSRCRATVSHCYHFKSNHSSDMAHEAGFMTPSYVELMWERLAFLQTILSFGYNFVHTDTDVMWLRNPFSHFYSDIDFQTSCDYFNGKPFDLDNSPNNGFNFVRSNNRTIALYKFWVNSRWKFPNMHEQDAFNRLKHHPFLKQIGLKIRFLDTDYFGGFCRPSKDFHKVCTMHANCCVGLQRKVVDLNMVLEDWKMYLSLTVNQTTSQQFHWRVPYECHM